MDLIQHNVPLIPSRRARIPKLKRKQQVHLVVHGVGAQVFDRDVAVVALRVGYTTPGSAHVAAVRHLHWPVEVGDDVCGRVRRALPARLVAEPEGQRVRCVHGDVVEELLDQDASGYRGSADTFEPPHQHNIPRSSTKSATHSD